MNGKYALPLLYLVSLFLLLFAYKRPSFGIEFLFVSLSLIAIYETIVWFVVPTRFQVERKLSKTRMPTMDSLQVEVILEWNAKFHLPLRWLKMEDSLPARLDVRKVTEEEIVFPMRSQRAVFRYRLVDLQRGGYHFQTVNVYMGDGLGLVTRLVEVPVSNHLIVYPRALNGPLPAPKSMGDGTFHMASLSKDEGEQVIGARPYRHGDRMQKIHWGASARTGALVTKEFETNLMQDEYLLLVADEEEYSHHPAAFEIALSLVARYFERWRNSGRSSQFWALGEKVHSFSCDHGHFNMRALDYLAIVSPEKTDMRKLRDTLTTIPKSARVDLIAFRPAASLTPWLELARSKKWQSHLWFADPQMMKEVQKEDSVMAMIGQLGLRVHFYRGEAES